MPTDCYRTAIQNFTISFKLNTAEYRNFMCWPQYYSETKITLMLLLPFKFEYIYF